MSWQIMRGRSRLGRMRVEQVVRRRGAVRTAILTTMMAVVIAMLPQMAAAVVVTDDFSDLNDTANPVWSHLDGATGSTGQTWDASTGQYHLAAPSDGSAPGVEGFGFVGTNIATTSFTDVRVSADLVDFPNIGPAGSNFAIMARSNNNNNPLVQDFENTLHAYSYQYEPGSDGGQGELVLSVFWAGGPKDVRSEKVYLDNTRDYRFVLEVIGSTLHGQVFDLTGGGVMVAEQWRDVIAEPVMLDHDGSPFTPDIPHELYTSGYSGLYAYGYILATDADVTFDNFRTETAVAGDYNRNGATDAADYVLWRNTLGQTGPNGNPPTSFGDMRANGAVAVGYTQTIDAADYGAWRAGFGTTASDSGLGNGSSVPEPSSIFLTMLGLAGLLSRRFSC